MKSNTAIGIMSGTSVDGLDIVLAEFINREDYWEFEILKSHAASYPEALKNKLINCIQFSGEELMYLDIEYGHYIAEVVLEFLNGESFDPLLIASHGHTVFHQPEKGITCQIGDGEVIFNNTGIPVINDFRKMDVIRGGQGAPLVPVGDKYLFPEYDFCLNIGGFSNVSFDDDKGIRRAYDISPANIVLNFLTRQVDKDYDPGGNMARKGRLIPDLLAQLNDLSYYKKPYPKSLGLEWVKKNIFPAVQSYLTKYVNKDLLRTCTEHISIQISRSIEKDYTCFHKGGNTKVLITGGGAYNDFLVERMRDNTDKLIYEIPDRIIIDFKEALVFAFLGILRWQGMVNIYGSVTGAADDSISGVIHGINPQELKDQFFT